MEKKVIKVDFVKKKRAKEEPEKKESTVVGKGLKDFIDSRGEGDPLSLIFQLALSGDLHERIDEIKRNTEGFSEEIYSKQRENLRSFTNEQLINFLMKSNSDGWHKSPAFFRAVLSEIQERLAILFDEKK